MEDKLIREKLNSLGSLPEGYAPNLDSKWELLRAGKPEKKRTPLYFWYAAAASLLLLLGLSFSFWKTENQPNAEPVAQQHISTEETNPKEPKPDKTEQPGNFNEPLIASTRSAQKSGMVKASKTPKTQVSIQSQAIPRADSAGQLFAEAQLNEETSVLVAAENPQKAAKKRNRYVELDFEAPETPQRLPQPVQAAQLQFKIKLLPQSSASGQPSVQEQNPLRLQHTF